MRNLRRWVPRQLRRRRFSSLGAGVTDSALSSLATFLVGLYAARSLEPSSLGAYALFFTAFVVAGTIPAHLILIPAEVASLSRPAGDRLRFGRTILLGSGPALLVGLGVLGVIPLVPADVPPDIVIPLALTATATAFVSPLQDHVRRSFHLDERSWSASVVAFVQLAGLVSIIGLAVWSDIPTSWIPFGSLAAANVLSLISAMILTRDDLTDHSEHLTISGLARSGRWLLPVGLLPFASPFVASVLVARLASAEALGLAEAARIVGQPLTVLALGLSWVLRRESMEAARLAQVATARRVNRIYVVLVSAGALAYGAYVSAPWAGNVFAYLLPSAYVVSGLVAVTVLANLSHSVLSLYGSELIGGRREHRLAWVEFLAAVAQVGTAAVASGLGAMAMPISRIGHSAAKWVGLRPELRDLYAQQPLQAPPAS